MLLLVMSHDTYFAAIYDQVLQFLKICKLSAAKKSSSKPPVPLSLTLGKLELHLCCIR